MLKSTPKSWQTDKFNNKVCFQFLLLNIGSSVNQPSPPLVQQTSIGNIYYSVFRRMPGTGITKPNQT